MKAVIKDQKEIYKSFMFSEEGLKGINMWQLLSADNK